MDLTTLRMVTALLTALANILRDAGCVGEGGLLFVVVVVLAGAAALIEAAGRKSEKLVVVVLPCLMTLGLPAPGGKCHSLKEIDWI